MADDGVGRVQNVLRGAVILLQPDGAGTLVLLFKAENVADVRAAETVNTLVIVAHHADIVPFVGQKAGQQVLQVVGVLILVDEDITEFVLVVRPHIRTVLQQPDGVQNDVVEVQRIGVPQLSVVKCIDFTDPDAPPIVDGLPLLDKRLRRLHIVLCTGNNAQDLSGWKRLLVQRQLLENVLNDPLAVVRIIDGEAAVKAETVDVPAQDTDTGGVKCGRPHVLRHLLPQHTAQPLLQLVGGLIGKGDGQHLPRAGGLHGAEVLHQRTLLLVGRFGVFLQKRRHVLRHGGGDIRTVAAPPVAQQIGHAVDKHRGLAGPGARQQQQRPLCGQHALLLARVQLLEVGGNGSTPRRDKSSLQFRHEEASLFSFLPSILIQHRPAVNRYRKISRNFVRFMLTRTPVRLIMQVEHKFDMEVTIMTTIGLLITLLGAGSIAANVMRLIDCIDHPAPCRRRRTA